MSNESDFKIPRKPADPATVGKIRQEVNAVVQERLNNPAPQAPTGTNTGPIEPIEVIHRKPSRPTGVPTTSTPQPPLGNTASGVSQAEQAAEGLWAKFAKQHWAAKTAMVAVPVAAVAGLGYWALRERNKDGKTQENSANTGIPSR